MTPSRLYRFLYRYWLLTFVLMGVFFVLFGLVSVDLVQTLMANFEFLSRYGRAAVAEGGLHQLAGLALSGYLAATFYLGFKLCEKVLVDRASTGRALRAAGGKGAFEALHARVGSKRGGEDVSKPQTAEKD